MKPGHFCETGADVETSHGHITINSRQNSVHHHVLLQPWREALEAVASKARKAVKEVAGAAFPNAAPLISAAFCR